MGPTRTGRERVRRGRTLALLVGLAVLATAAYVVRVGRDMVDFDVGYVAGHRLLAGQNLYPGTDGHFSYKYPPGAALLQMPFGLLPPPLAKPVFYAVTVLCLVAALWLAYRLLPPGPARRPALVAWTFLVLAQYLLREIDLGQINLIILCLLLLAVHGMLARDDAARATGVGSAWASATTLKPYALVFLPYCVLTGRWRTLAAGLGALALLAAAPALFYGPAGAASAHVAWARTLSESTPSLMTHVDNASLGAFFARLVGWGSTAMALTFAAAAGLALLVLLVVLRGRGRPRAVVLDGLLLIALIPLLAPLGWNYMMLMSLGGVMLLLQQLHRFTGVWRWLLVADLVTIGIAISNVIGHEVHAAFVRASGPTIQFAVLVGYLAALRFKRVC